MVEKLLSLLRKEKNSSSGLAGFERGFHNVATGHYARDIAPIWADPEKYVRLDLLSALAWRRYVRRREEIIPVEGTPKCRGLIPVVSSHQAIGFQGASW